MKHLFFIFISFFILVSFTSCSNDKDDDPVSKYTSPSQLIPPYVFSSLGEDMNIYEGNTPPNIEGKYYLNDLELKSSSGDDEEVGKKIDGFYIDLSNQANGSIDLKKSRSNDIGSVSLITGHDEYFTIYNIEYDLGAESNPIIDIEIISGKKTAKGIDEIVYAYVTYKESSMCGLLPFTMYIYDNSSKEVTRL